MGLCWWLLTGLGRDSRRSAAVFALVAGLGWLVRPDMAIGTLFLLAAGWYLVRPSLRRSALLLAVGGALPVAYQIFRMGYYSLLTPNTAVAKDASSTHFAQGLTYLANFVTPYRLWAPLLLLALLVPLTIGRRLSRADLVTCAAAVGSAAAMAVYVVAIGGDFMHARMLLPATFALLLPVMAIPLPRPDLATLRTNVRTAVPVALCLLMVCAWALACGTSWRVVQKPGVISASGIEDERAFWAAYIHQKHPDSAGEYVSAIMGDADADGSMEWIIGQDLASGRPVLIYTPDNVHTYSVPLDDPAYPVGITAIVLGTSGSAVPLNGLVVDQHGLSYAVGSHVTGTPGGRPGHDKYVGVAWIIAEYTDVTSAPGVPSAQIEAARRALGCGGLARLEQATTGPLGFGKFWSNVLHAASLTDLSFSPNPVVAAGQLCG